jgi:hypothetical protein
MKIRPRITRLLIAAVFGATSCTAMADISLTAYSSQASFIASVTPGSFLSANTYDFSDQANMTHPGDSGGYWATHGVTYYTGGQNLNIIVGPSVTGLTSNVLTNNATAGSSFIAGAIGDGFNLFGFDLGIFGSANVSLTVNSVDANLGVHTYQNSSMTVPKAPTALSFFGFTAGSGEHFTSFNITSSNLNAKPLLDNVTLGYEVASPVPEPEILSMLAPGLLLLGFAARRRGSRPPV